jgi:hypothetical protein
LGPWEMLSGGEGVSEGRRGGGEWVHVLSLPWGIAGRELKLLKDS